MRKKQQGDRLLLRSEEEDSGGKLLADPERVDQGQQTGEKRSQMQTLSILG